MGDQERGAGASGPCRGLGQRPKTCAAAQPRKRCERTKGRKKRGSLHPHRFPHPGPQGHHPPCGPFFCPASAGFRPPRAEISGRTHGSRKAVNAVGGLEGPKVLQSEIVSPGFAGRAGSLRLWAQTFRKPLAEKIAEGELFRHATKGANPHDLHQSQRRAAARGRAGRRAAGYRDAAGTEYLWSGDPAVWKGVSPVLFPAIGALRDGGASIAGRALSRCRATASRGSCPSASASRATTSSPSPSPKPPKPGASIPSTSP